MPTRFSAAYLFDVRVKGDRHVQQDLALLHAANKVLDPVLQLVGGLVDLLRVALARLGKLLGRLQQLVCIGVRVLHESGGARGVRENAEHKGEKKTMQETKKKRKVLSVSAAAGAT